MNRIFTTTGIRFGFDDAIGVTAVDGPATLALSFDEDAPFISYSQITAPDPGVLPEVEIGGDAPLLIAIDDLLFGDELDSSIGRLTWSGGTTDVLSLWVSDDEQYLFRLSGAPFPPLTTAAQANAFLNEAIVNGITLPPPGSGLEPGTNIPMSSLDGWSSIDASDATAYQVDALSFVPGLGPTDPPQGVQASSVTFVMQGGTDPGLFYQSLGLEPDAGPTGAGAVIARPGFTDQPFTVLIDGEPITSLQDGYSVFFARVVSGGATRDLLNIEDLGTGRQYLVSLGGAPLPDGTDPAAAAAFFAGITRVDPIPAGSGAPGEVIPLSDLPGVDIGDYGPSAPPVATGDPAVLTFSGHKLVYDGDTLDSVAVTEFKVALPAADSVFSYQITGTDDGLPLVDIGGTNPYAGLLDGVALGDDIDNSVARIVAEGVSYDVLIFIDRTTNTDYIFQIDGSTPLPFGTLAEAEAFRAALDGGGSVGAIPAGSPFAPGLNFQLTDSPYLSAIDSSPAIILGGDQYDARPAWGVADGAGTEGSLTVVNGETLTLDSDDRGPFLQVGRGTGAEGTITVAGPGSKIEIVAGGDETDGVSANFGRDGGMGTLRVVDGARFEITDPNGASGGPNGDGWEFLQAGRGAGALGRIDVFGGSLAVLGTGASMTIGRDGGTGFGYVEDGALRIESTTNDLARLQLGRNGGSGSLDVRNDGRVFVQADDGGNAQVQIGLQSGTGSTTGGELRIIGGVDSGLVAAGGANSPRVAIDVGIGANGVDGSGVVEVSGGFFGALNRGNRLDDAMNEVVPVGVGGEAEIVIGRNDGTAAVGSGAVSASNGAIVFASGTSAGRITLGGGDGADGDLVLSSGARVNALSDNGEAGIEIGGWDGGAGYMELRGSIAEIIGNAGAYLNVGRGAGNFGAMVLAEDSQAFLRGDNNFTAFEIGTHGGTGMATLLSGAQLRFLGVDRFLGIGRGDGDTSGNSDGTLALNGAGTRLWAAFNTVVGEDAGSGTLRIEDEAAAILGRTDADTDVSFIVGRGANSDGLLEVSDARLSLQGANGGFEPYMAFGLDGGTGSAVITGARSTDPLASHGVIQIGGGSSPFATLDIGRGVGSVGSVSVAGAFFGTQNDGSTFSTEAPFGEVDLPGDGGRAVMRVGLQGGTGTLTTGADSEIFAQGGANGAAVIVGESGGTGTFTMTGGRLLIEGAENLAFLGIGSGGTGSMTMSDGALGRIELLSAQTGFQDAGIAIGYQGGAGGGAGDGTLILDGADTALAVVGERFANLNVGGIEGTDSAGEGLLRITNGATLSYESTETQQLNIGRAGGDGTLEVLSGGTFAARTTGTGFDSFLLVGTEGGTGNVRVDAASLSLVSEGGNAGIRVGTRWTHTDNNTGTGSLILENGASAAINGAGTGDFWVGGLEGGNGSAIIRSGASLSMTGPDTLAMIGGVFGQTDAPGGTGTLDMTGAGTALIGADTLLVGFNNGTGTLTLSDSALIEIEGGGSDAFLGIGVHSGTTGNGGVGSGTIDGLGSILSVSGTDAEALIGSQNSDGILRILNGGRMQIEAGVGGPEGTTGALLDIGRDGGDGTVSLAGNASALTVTGANGLGGAIRVATDGAGSFGHLHIADGASARADSVSIGASDTKGVVVLANGGELTANTITVNAEGVLGGAGTITGDVTVTGGSIGAGDTWQVGGGPTDGGYGIGTLAIVGDLTQTGGEAFFDFGTTGDDLLDVGGALSFTNTAFTLVHNGDLPAGDFAVKLAQAAGGITLSGTTLAQTSFDGVAGATPALELRAGGTELWFVAGADLPPPTGQAITMSELGREGSTITYGISVDPALVTNGVLDDLALTLNFDDTLVGYVPGSVSGGFTATPGSLVIEGSGLNISDLSAPVVTFEMDMTARPGARSLGFDISGVSVNGIAMQDQTGADAPSFDYTPAFFTLSGAVDIRDTASNEISPQGTTVSFTPGGGAAQEISVGADGAYSFLLEAGTSGTLEVLRSYSASPAGPDKALGIQDVLGLFRMVVGASTVTPEGDDFLAADFNGDGGVNIADVLGLFRHIVGSPGAPDPRYIFVDDAADLSGVSLADTQHPSGSFTIDPIAADTSLGFLGILSGDLQGQL
jgi:hypothetical protein